MDIEHTTKTIPIDQNFQAEIKKLHEEGWAVLPDIIPVAIYHLVREKRAAVSGAMGNMIIDESKVWVINKDGQRVQ